MNTDQLHLMADKTYPLEVPVELWEEWKKHVPRKYSRVGGRIIELLSLDLAYQQEHGVGVIEYLELQDMALDDPDVSGSGDVSDDSSSGQGDED